jgi:hypothetical protein
MFSRTRLVSMRLRSTSASVNGWHCSGASSDSNRIAHGRPGEDLYSPAEELGPALELLQAVHSRVAAALRCVGRAANVDHAPAGVTLYNRGTDTAIVCA